jgi:hypothetical protein
VHKMHWVKVMDGPGEGGGTPEALSHSPSICTSVHQRSGRSTDTHLQVATHPSLFSIIIFCLFNINENSFHA